MLSRGDDDEEADDLTDLLTALLEATVGPEGGDRLEVVKELSAVAEDVDSLTSNDLEDLASTDVSDDVPDGLLETGQTAGLEGLGDGLDGIGKLKKSTLDGLDAKLLDASPEVGPGSVHVSDDDVDVTGAARGIAHGRAHALSDTADESVDVSRGGRNIDLSFVLIDEDAENLTNSTASTVVVLGLPVSDHLLEDLDELAAVRPDVHDLVLDEGLDLSGLDLGHDLDDGVGSLLEAAGLEGVGQLLNTVSKGKEALHDRLDVEGLDAVSDQLDGVVEVASHVGDIPDTGSGVAHDHIKADRDTLEEIEDVILGLHLAVLLELGVGGNDEARLIDCAGRDHQGKENKSD